MVRDRRVPGRIEPFALGGLVLLAAVTVGVGRPAPIEAQSSSTTSTTWPALGFTAVCGDPSGDNRLTATDAAVALNAAVGLASCVDCRCDVDFSGAVTATDSTLMLKASVGDPISLSCPACIAAGCGTTTTTLLNPNAPRRLVVTKSGGGSGTVSDGVGGIDCGCDCSNRYAEGTKLQLQATPDASSFFTAWGGDVPTACQDTTGPCILRMGRDRSVTATFVPARLLSVATTGAGKGKIADDAGTIDCGTDCSEKVPNHTLVTLRGTPEQGSYFAGWGGSGVPPSCAGITRPCVMLMGRDRSVTGSFALGNTLDVKKSGPGSGKVSGAGIRCGSDCTETYAPGTTVTLRAEPDSPLAVPGGATFQGWSKDVPSTCTTTTGPCTVTMSQSRKVTATFGRICPTSGPIMKTTAGGLGLMLNCSDLGYVYRQRTTQTVFATDGDEMVIAQGGELRQVTYEATVTSATFFTLRTASLNGATPTVLGTGSTGRITDDGSQLDLVVILTNGERFDFLGATYDRTEKLSSSANLEAPATGLGDAGTDPLASSDAEIDRLSTALAR